MAAPILWARGKIASFLQENPMSIKFLVLGGGVFRVLVGGSADFIFMGARIDVAKSLYKLPREFAPL